jgi:parvulin-like peptidyl-prolyl isomerase
MRLLRLSIFCLIPCVAAWRAPAGGSLADPSTATIDANLNPRPTTLPSIDISDPRRVVATVGDKEITLGMVAQPVVDMYGLLQLQAVAQREYYRQKAAEEKVTITPDEEQATRDRMLNQIFASGLPLSDFTAKMPLDEAKAARKQEMEKLLPQVLAPKNLTVEDLNRAIPNESILWKIAYKQTVANLTEDDYKQVFGLKYGEKVSVRHIQVANLAKAVEILQRLNKGERFMDIADKESLDLKSRAYGGEVRAFTRNDPIWKPAFREAAFSLKEDGEISDPINTGEVYEIIQRNKRIAPSAIEYDLVKDDIKAELVELVTLKTVDSLRQRFNAEASSSLRISDPGLQERFQRMVDSASRPKDMNETRNQIKRDNDVSIESGSEVAQPPATGPGK